MKMERKEFEKAVKECSGKLFGVYLSGKISIWATDYATFEKNIELFHNGAFIARVPLKLIQKVY